ncbi:hypothetical protein, partial [Duganella sp. 3397]|uniref:hypothetical protein n=1 Tax=Duganella sp. 3397 TaxID=2817732 RepID=UPI00286BC2C8
WGARSVAIAAAATGAPACASACKAVLADMVVKIQKRGEGDIIRVTSTVDKSLSAKIVTMTW